MTNKVTKLIPQERMQIQEGTTVAEVKKYGSDGQKIAAALFDFQLQEVGDDFGKDGVYDDYEARVFNNYNFTHDSTNKVFRMYNRENGTTVEIKYNNIEDLNTLLNDSKWNEPDKLEMFENGKRTLACFLSDMYSGKATIDLTQNSITLDNAQAGTIGADYKKVVINNSDISKIYTSAEEVEINNTRNHGLFWNSATKLEVEKDTNVKVSKDSNVQIIRGKEEEN